jgi:hypothetical protein
MRSAEFGRSVIGPFFEDIFRAGRYVDSFLKEFPIKTLEELPQALEDAGVELVHVDLDLAVSEGHQVGRYIFLDPHPEEDRRIFTLLHEVGHYWIHHLGGISDDAFREDLDVSLFAYYLIFRVEGPEANFRIMQCNPKEQHLLFLTMLTACGVVATGGFWWLAERIPRLFRIGAETNG